MHLRNFFFYEDYVLSLNAFRLEIYFIFYHLLL